MSANRLEMHNISLAFSGFQALNKVDFTLHGGSVHALTGANGAGKSTLMAVLCGTHAHYEGEVTIALSGLRFGINRTLRLLRCRSAPSIQILQQFVHTIIGKHRLKRCGKFTSPVFILVTGAGNIYRICHIQPVFRL